MKNKINKTNLKTTNKILTNDEFKEVSLIRNPIVTLSTFIIIIIEKFLQIIKFVLKNYLILLIVFTYLFFNYINTPFKADIQYFNKILYYCGYWILLGIASSIGLGTGLHTFVLYLGPYIAKVTLAANECSYFPEMNPNRWEFKDFKPCNKLVDNNANIKVSLLTILFNVQLEALMWGIGTALGELPPYFMAKAAAESGNSNEEINEVELAKTNKSQAKFIDKIKLFIYNHLKKHGFITVLLCASIPNPLFDLAGITCGHFGIPFWTFFGATLIGKAIIKVHIQAITVILAFSKHHVDFLLNFIETNIPFLHGVLTSTLEKQKKSLFNNSENLDIDNSKPLIANIWEVFITVMILYFLYSIINSLVNERLRKDANKKNK